MTEENKQNPLDDEQLKDQAAEQSAEQAADQPSDDASPGDNAAAADASPETEAASDDSDVAVETAENDAEASGDDDQSFDKTVNPDDVPEDDAEAAMMAMLEDLPQEEAGAKADDIEFGEGTAAKAEFQQLSEPARSGEARNIELLMDVNLPVSIELGRTKMSISDILALGPGSVVELSKLAGEPVDLLVNYKIIARGEVVVVDENFGVRITQLMTPEQRLKALGEQ